MKSHSVLAALIFLSSAPAAWAWGQEGHSIVAEIAQRRLTPAASQMVETLLGTGHSLASVASWADDVRDARPGSYNWHFVDIPIAQDALDRARDCKTSTQGDCVVAELERLAKEIPCSPTQEQKLDALKFAVHFVGDLHQPMHAVGDQRGGNGVTVKVKIAGMTCTGKCQPSITNSNLHKVWDSDLIQHTVYDWGAYVDRLEDGWLKSAGGNASQVAQGTPADWAVETHKVAQGVWNQTPADHLLQDNYYTAMLPILDQQLGRAGLRLAKFLNDSAAASCPAR